MSKRPAHEKEELAMEKIAKDEYLFSVEKEKTTVYYQTHSLCDCEGCRNFYAQIRGMFPELEAFLAEFGVDIAKPDEMPWLELDDQIQYTPCYTVTGSIEKMGTYEIDIGNQSLAVYRSGDLRTDIPNEQTEPYFVLEVFSIYLPWVLDTPFPSAPTRKNFLARLFHRRKKG